MPIGREQAKTAKVHSPRRAPYWMVPNTPNKTRFEDGVGTNPEELIGAAHAGCFTMQLSFLLNEKGYTATSLDTEAKVTFEDGSITQVELDLKGEVEGISEADFNAIAEKAKEICPISKLLNTAITLSVALA